MFILFEKFQFLGLFGINALMKFKWWASVFYLFLLTFLLGCEESHQTAPQTVAQTVAGALDESDDFESWNRSGYHPEKVFDDWLEWQTDSSAVCGELSKLSNLDLTVFENQIRDPKYKSLLVGCQRLLIRRLDLHWKRERESVALPHLDFKFTTETLVMDNLPRTKILTQRLAPKQVLLTFDDGPHPEYTKKMLKIFKQTGVKALFFLLGENVRRFPNEVYKIASEGHAVASHTESHSCVALNSRCRKNSSSLVSSSYSYNEIASGVRSLIQVLGWSHPFFRFPYGESSPELQRYLYARGFFDFYWSIDSEDWKKRGLNDYYHRLIAKIDRQQGGNILFHDIQKRTLEVMPLLLKYLYNHNYTIVVVKAKPITDF